MLAASAAGADVVDAAIDAMSGMTSQPSMGAIVANLRGDERAVGLDLTNELPALNSYWENVRSLYEPFESGQLSGSSDVYFHEVRFICFFVDSLFIGNCKFLTLVFTSPPFFLYYTTDSWWAIHQLALSIQTAWFDRQVARD